MPEGDTLHKVATFMHPLMAGNILQRAEAAHTRLPQLEGEVVREVTAVGKHLLVCLQSWVVRVHLGMYGAWHHYQVGERWRKPSRQASVVLTLGDQIFVCFNADDVECLRPHEVQSSEVGRLGPDLLSPSLDDDGMQEIVRRSQHQAPLTPLVDILLNQRIAAGLGNVYKSELLFIKRLHPLTPVVALSSQALLALWELAREQMRANTGGWRRTTTYDRRSGVQLRQRLFVYGRMGKPCVRCPSQVIARDYLGKHRRSTYFCPACQGLEGTS